MNRQVLMLAGIAILVFLLMPGACTADGTAAVTAGETFSDDMRGLPAFNPAETAAGTDSLSDIPTYDGPVGPGSPLYGLKIAFEDLDESFTLNETERFNKQLNNAKLRLSEVKRELALNNTDSADRALDLYWLKTNLTALRLSVIASSNATGLLHAQEMVVKHQFVLQGLLASHPNNTGLARAYNNSRALEQKFAEKTETKFERVMAKNNKTILKAVRLTLKEQEKTANRGEETMVRVQQAERVKGADGNGTGKGKGPAVSAALSVRPTETGSAAATVAPAATKTEKPEHPGSSGNGKGNAAGTTGQETGNGKNK